MSNLTPEAPTLAEAPILHVDLDAFFASVEILDNPSLRGKPVCVGGSGTRGVVASASYEARRFGISSAMPSVVARRLCPSLIMLPGRFDRYESYSAQFHTIINDVTPHFEPISLDEVFLDLRGLHALRRTPLDVAHEIRTRLRDELFLDCGVGVARNKLFAKLASKDAKPVVDARGVRPGRGVVWVDPATEASWLATLPVRALWGVGPATAKKLQQLGLGFVRDLVTVDERILTHHVGPAMAAMLASYAIGEDPREVISQREMKSLGHDQTFGQSVVGLDGLRPHIAHHAGVVARAVRGRGQVARTITVIVRFDDLQSVQRSQTLPFGVDDESAIATVTTALVESIPLLLPIRLLGIHLSSFLERERNEVQLSFDVVPAAQGKSEAVEVSRGSQVGNEALRDTLDAIRQRYGASSVGLARDVGTGGVSVDSQRGSTPFGPAGPSEQ